MVFSDQTLDIFQRYDPVSHAAILENFAYWDDIAVHFKNEVIRVGGNGFCGCSRQTLLRLLQERAAGLGVALHFEQEITDLDVFAGSDLIVAADGINSRVRALYEDHFKPVVDLRPNKFVWLGSTRPFDAFTFFFRETDHGVFIAHCYQYEEGHSTWVIETDPATWDRAGLAGMSEAQLARFPGRRFRRGTDGPQAHHQPVAVAQFPDDPQRALGEGQYRSSG